MGTLPPGGLDPWLWAILGLVLGVAETMLPGAYLIFVAAGLLVTGAVSGIAHLDLSGQLTVLPVACLASCAVGFFVYRAKRPATTKSELNDGFAWIVGATGTVVEDIEGGAGRIMVGDGFWMAAGPDLPKGTLVKVVGIDGDVARVVPLPHEK